MAKEATQRLHIIWYERGKGSMVCEAVSRDCDAPNRDQSLWTARARPVRLQ